MLTKEQMDALPGLVAEATQGPWTLESGSVWAKEFGYTVELFELTPADENERSPDDCRLIALTPALAATVIEQQAEIERLREIVLRDAKRRMRELTEWLNEDEANPVLLRMAAEDVDLQTLRTILEAAQ